MNADPCMLCGKPIEDKDSRLCSVCHKMDLAVTFLVENFPDRARTYLGYKFNQVADREERKFDRRSLEYNPPRGTHTPDRRKRVRRLKQTPYSPRRRKSDQC